MSDDAAKYSGGPVRQSAAGGTPPGRDNARYGCQIIRSIGRGAYGEVFLVTDAAGVYRALKIISRESFDHDRPYEREYEGIRKFEIISKSYSNQVQVFSVGRREEPREFFYFMELADDEKRGQNIRAEDYSPRTLRSELKARGRLPAAECVRIGIALANAVESLHENGLIHRDIKPANIIFVKGVPKLADIGLLTHADVSVSHVGTEGFIPPEGPGSVEADIYSLGKVLYEMCTGNDRMDFPELPANLEELPDREEVLELNAIVATACERQPGKRYHQARAMLEDFQRIRRGGSVRRKRAVRRRLKFAAWVAVLVAGVSMAVTGTDKLWRRYARPGTTGARAPRVPKPDDPQNLIVNGSFERPAIPLSGNKLGLFIIDATNLSPWQTTAPTFEVWADDVTDPGLRFAPRSADGFQNLEILSTVPEATVWQTVPTTTGQRYVLSFYHTPRPEAVSTLTVAIDSAVIGVFPEDGMGLTNFEWRRFTTNFIATSDRTTVSFADDNPKHHAVGTHLDGVVLKPAR